jgi:hypothetical protein
MKHLMSLLLPSLEKVCQRTELPVLLTCFVMRDFLLALFLSQLGWKLLEGLQN